MYLDGRLFLDLLDEAARFSVARLVTKATTATICDTIVMCWSYAYKGFPNIFSANYGFQFRKVFAKLADVHDINVEKTGTEAHHSLEIVERYHKPLRDTYRRLKIDHPSMQRQLLLSLKVKAMNDTLGPEGTVSSGLVFGEFPSLRSLFGSIVPRPTPAEREEAALEAR